MNITHERKDVVDHSLVRLVVYDDSPEPGTNIVGTHTSLVAHRNAGWLTIGVRKRTAVRSTVKVATLSPDACHELYAMLREIYEA